MQPTCRNPAANSLSPILLCVLANTPMESNGLMCYPAACECSTRRCRMMLWIIPSLPFARPAYVHRFDVSLNMVFVLMLVFIGRPEPDRQTHFWLLEVSITVLQPSSVNTISPRRVIYPLESDWSAHCYRTSSVKVMALSKIWYVLYPLGSPAFALNSRESQIGGSCLTSPRYIPK